MRATDKFPAEPGIYAIRNLVNGKIYVGSTSNLRKSNYGHRWRLRSNQHECAALQKDWNAYGADKFTLEALEILHSKDRSALKLAEEKWSLKLQSNEDQWGYNRLTVIEKRQTSIAQIPRTTGVYLIRNTHNGRIYIGCTVNHRGFRQRWLTHKSNLQRGVHQNRGMQNDWNTFGEETFIFEILEILDQPTKAQAEIREQFWMDHFEAYPKGYNQRPNAASNAGNPASPETKEKRRKIMLAKSKEISQWVTAYLTGKQKSEATKRKIGEYHSKNYIVTDPQGEKQTVHNLRKFCRDNNLGYGNMQNAAGGKIKHTKGWQCERLESKELRIDKDVNHLKKLRTIKNLTQQKLSILCKVPATGISAIEKWGYMPSKETCERIAKALNITVQEIWPEMKN